MAAGKWWPIGGFYRAALPGHSMAHVIPRTASDSLFRADPACATNASCIQPVLAVCTASQVRGHSRHAEDRPNLEGGTQLWVNGSCAMARQPETSESQGPPPSSRNGALGHPLPVQVESETLTCQKSAPCAEVVACCLCGLGKQVSRGPTRFRQSPVDSVGLPPLAPRFGAPQGLVLRPSCA